MGAIPIKSVQRVFEILEFFDEVKRPVAAKEVAARYGYPLMSAHALLKSIHRLGYADFDENTWAYTPSRSFIELLDWARDFLDREQEIQDFMAALNIETMETINLSRRTNAEMKILHGMETRYPIGVSVKVGTIMPAAQSLTGLTALACLEKDKLEKALGMSDRRAGGSKVSFDRKLFNSVVEELNTYGTVAMQDVFVEGIGAVCFPVSTRYSKETLVIGVVGPSNRIENNSAKYRKIIKRLATKYRVSPKFQLRNA